MAVWFHPLSAHPDYPDPPDHQDRPDRRLAFLIDDAAVPTRNLSILVLIAVVCVFCYSAHRRTRHALVVADALELIDQMYIDPVDDRELLIAALSGMTKGLDPYSEFISLQRYEQLQSTMSGEFAGIGIYVDRPDADGPVQVVTPLVGSPALDAGLMAGDQFIEIDQEDVSKMGLSEVSRRLKGPIGTFVDVVVGRGDEKVAMKVRRDNIRMESVVGYQRVGDQSWDFRLPGYPAIAYARLTTFGEKTPEELRVVLENLDDQVESLVLDLRANGGGLLDTAVSICDLFLAGGVVVSTEIRGGQVEYEYAVGQAVAVDPTLPIVILIDHNSASASEIVAAAMQDRGRARIVGTRSFGKGTVQNVLPLEVGRSALKLTVARYLRPSGENIHRTDDAGEEDVWGVKPLAEDIVELNEEDQNELFLQWRQRAFPFAAEIDRDRVDAGETNDDPAAQSDDDVEIDVDVDNEVEVEVDAQTKVEVNADPEAEAKVEPGGGNELDPQLRRAVEILAPPEEPSLESPLNKAA